MIESNAANPIALSCCSFSANCASARLGYVRTVSAMGSGLQRETDRLRDLARGRARVPRREVAGAIPLLLAAVAVVRERAIGEPDEQRARSTLVLPHERGRAFGHG